MKKMVKQLLEDMKWMQKENIKIYSVELEIDDQDINIHITSDISGHLLTNDNKLIDITNEIDYATTHNDGEYLVEYIDYLVRSI